MSIHNQNITVTVNLKQFDGPSHHVGQGRLFSPRRDFVGKGQVIGRKKSEEPGLLPPCDLFQLRQIVNDANLCLIQPFLLELCCSTTQGDVDCIPLDQGVGKFLRLFGVVGVGIEGCRGWVGQRPVSHNSGSTTFLVRDLDNRSQGIARFPKGNRSVSRCGRASRNGISCSRSGKPFEARLKLDGGEVRFDFGTSRP